HHSLGRSREPEIQQRSTLRKAPLRVWGRSVAEMNDPPGPPIFDLVSPAARPFTPHFGPPDPHNPAAPLRTMPPVLAVAPRRAAPLLPAPHPPPGALAVPAPRRPAADPSGAVALAEPRGVAWDGEFARAARAAEPGSPPRAAELQGFLAAFARALPTIGHQTQVRAVHRIVQLLRHLTPPTAWIDGGTALVPHPRNSDGFREWAAAFRSYYGDADGRSTPPLLR
ncbi:hypothetical protein DFJ74DRAFT_743523, partial [Hyaloraphidium curvatum]